MPGHRSAVRMGFVTRRGRCRSRAGMRLIVAAAAWTVHGACKNPSLAAPPALSVPSEEAFQPANGQPESGVLGYLDSLNRSSLMLGDMGGLRTELSKYGISLAIQETSEVLGNVTGGTHKGADYDGLTQMLLQLDTNRAFGWYGGTFNVSALQIHGSDLSADNLQTLQTASGIEADRSTRLWELWYQQKFLEEDRLDVRIGQQSLDQEFMVSQNASYFVNTMFGWPMVPSADLPGGGPAYPLSALGVRVRARPINSLTFLAGRLQRQPGRRPTSATRRWLIRRARAFPLNGGLLVIAEMQYSLPIAGNDDHADQPQPLARIYKLGFWYDTESFADQQFDNTGLSLANPASNGMPLNHHGDFSDLCASPTSWSGSIRTRATGRSTCSRAMLGAPQADRNLITFSVNAGLTFHEPFLHRDDDTFGIGMGFAKVSGSAAALDQATAAFTNSYRSDAQQRNLRRNHLPIPGDAVAAAPAGHSVRVHARWRPREPQ